MVSVRTGLRSLAAGVLLSGAVGVSVGLPATAEPLVTFSYSPDSGPVGTTVSFSGADCNDGKDTVSFYFDEIPQTGSPGVHLGTVPIQPDGTFSGTLVIPGTLNPSFPDFIETPVTPGTHSIIGDCVENFSSFGDESFRFDFTVTGAPPAAFDFDGDGTADRGVYRNGGWLISGQATSFLGVASDLPIPADYNGDGITDKAVYRNGTWFTQGQGTVYFGNPGDVPVPADYNGDGSADRMVFRNGAWLSPTVPAVYFGKAGDIPVSADYTGDGSADRMIYRNGAWLSPVTSAVYFGNATDRPVPADYTGDGAADRTVYRNGGWLSPVTAPVYFGNAADKPLSLPVALR